MERTLFREEHEIFRRSFRQFVEREVVPNQERWREAGSVLSGIDDPSVEWRGRRSIDRNANDYR